MSEIAELTYVTIHQDRGAWWGRIYFSSRYCVHALPRPTFTEALIAALNLYQAKAHEKKHDRFVS